MCLGGGTTSVCGGGQGGGGRTSVCGGGGGGGEQVYVWIAEVLYINYDYMQWSQEITVNEYTMYCEMASNTYACTYNPMTR